MHHRVSDVNILPANIERVRVQRATVSMRVYPCKTGTLRMDMEIIHRRVAKRQILEGDILKPVNWQASQ